MSAEPAAVMGQQDAEAALRWRRKVRWGPDCWSWAGAHSGGGYAQMWLKDRLIYAHRFAYELYKAPIPAGLDLDHLCQNPGCVNPDHLEAVTHGENIRRGRGATKTHCVHGHPYTPENTYKTPKGHRRCITCRRIQQGTPL